MWTSEREKLLSWQGNLIASDDLHVVCMASVQRGGRGKVKFEHETPSLGSGIALCTLLALRARI